MIIRFLIIFFAVVAHVQAAQWEQTLATTASLRTGGAHLVSSDVLGLTGGDSALITYWESARGTNDRDIYRCVDIVDSEFEPISQACWKVLTPAGRRPIEND